MEKGLFLGEDRENIYFTFNVENTKNKEKKLIKISKMNVARFFV